MQPLRIFIGFDGRELDAYQVAEASLRKHASAALEIQPLVLEQLRWKGVYTRPHSMRDDRIFDEISGAPMATEFALTRFLVPVLAGFKGWALFCDCDFLFRSDVAELFALADESKAVMVVKHDYRPQEAVKMDGQVQTTYPRKNWSSLVLWNCAHYAHAGQQDRVNRWKGLQLHGFDWLKDVDIGSLPGAWNWLEMEPKAVHFTRGTPDMLGYGKVAFADEWREELHRACGKAAA